MLFGYGDCHLGTMSIIIDADVLDVSKVVKINKEFLTIERGRFYN